MSRLWRYVAIGVGLVVVVIAVLVARILNAAGEFDDIRPVALSTCKTIGGLKGSEDMQVDRETKTLFVSSGDFRSLRAGKPSAQDGIYALSPDHPELGLHKLAGAPADFHPHGISLYRAPDGVLTLMAVNHPGVGKPSTVEIFEVAQTNAGPSLNHVGSISGELLHSPNDVVAVGKDRFYASNDHGSETDFGMLLENYLMLPRASVVYYDGNAFRTVADGLLFANGVNVSPNRAFLYVAETTRGTVKTYSRDVISGTLTLQNEFDVARGVDNIDVDQNGDLWVASHPKVFKLVARGSDPTALSPSRITKVTLSGGIPASTVPVYINLGEQVSGSSVGVTFAGHLYIGSVYGPGVLDCSLAK
jgi:arylesterase/paraoxonase